jgi:DNA polymerase-3 subunit alpha
MHDIKEITNFIEECKRMTIDVLGPDINESEQHFVVNKKGQIRFGMAGIKNVGENAVQSIIEERTENGPFRDIFEFLSRVDLRSVNKRSLESLAKAGGFDSFPGTHRAQYFYKIPGEEVFFLEKLLRYANDVQARASSRQHSLFGGEQEVMLPRIELPACAPWKKMDQLKFEKEIIGFYMSGHPLDEFRLEIENFCTVSVGELKTDMKLFKGREVIFAGIITEATHRTGKTGKPFGTFIVEDYFDSIQIMLFSEEFLKMKHFLEVDSFVHIKARVESRYDAPDQMNLRINTVTMLQEVFEKFAKSITVSLSLQDVTKENIAFLHTLARKHKGKNLLRIQVKDDEERLCVELPSKKFRVEAKEFSRGLTGSPDFSFKIN